MKNHSTSRDVQRVSFVESLHSNLQKQSARVLKDHERLVTLAKSYVEDGLNESESIELLMIDGLSRESAENYISLAMCENEESSNDQFEYSFQFEDDYGRIWSSYDINKTVRAATDEEAIKKAQDLFDPDVDIYPSKIISIDRIEE